MSKERMCKYITLFLFFIVADAEIKEMFAMCKLELGSLKEVFKKYQKSNKNRVSL